MRHGIWGAGLLIAGAMLAAPAAAAAGSGELAWTRDATSAGLQAEGRAVAAAYTPGARDGDSVLPRAVIAGVYAARHYLGTARVVTRLCWGTPQGPCVDVQGTHLNTHAFDGRPAGGPLWLVHQVRDWGGDHPPLFVRGTVTVWYEIP